MNRTDVFLRTAECKARACACHTAVTPCFVIVPVFVFVPTLLGRRESLKAGCIPRSDTTLYLKARLTSFAVQSSHHVAAKQSLSTGEYQRHITPLEPQ